MSPEEIVRTRVYDPFPDDPNPPERKPEPFPFVGLAIVGLCVLTALAIGAGMAIAFGRLWG